MDPPPATPLIRSFERHLRAANRAPTTVATYLHAIRQAHRFLHARGTTLEAATRADLEAFMTDLLAHRAPATAATYHKVLKILYAWLLEEGEVPADPTLRLRRPIVPDKPVPIVPDDGLKRLFQACAGNSFEARRDTALLMLLVDTGARRDEMIGITLDDIAGFVSPRHHRPRGPLVPALRAVLPRRRGTARRARDRGRPRPRPSVGAAVHAATGGGRPPMRARRGRSLV